MPRKAKIYTRTGDDGTTGLGNGARVAKTALRVEAYGTIDELNAVIGVAAAHGPSERGLEVLHCVQGDLLRAGAELSMPNTNAAVPPANRIEPRHIEVLEAVLDELSAELDPLANFILPGGTCVAAALQVARTVCRRAERVVLRLGQAEPVSGDLQRYLNRLSDALFVLARYENKAGGGADKPWLSGV